MYPDHDRGEKDEPFEVDGPALKASCETAKVLEVIKTPFGTVSSFVSNLIMRNADFARAAYYNHLSIQF